MEHKIINLLETLVNIDSGTGDAEGMERIASIIKDYTQGFGGTFDKLTASDGSGHYYFKRGQGKKILLMAHIDTVFPKGTVSKRPFQIEGDIAKGPGVSDCKSGVVTILGALDMLNLKGWPNCQIECLFNSDEENSSPGSREIIQELAKDASIALVVEPAEGENLTVARKGIGRFKLRVFGKAAHSGSNYEDGCNAILEMAHQIIAIQKLTNISEGLTLNPGVVSGGSKPNIIPDYAELDIDLRVKSPDQTEKILNALAETAAKTTVAGTRCILEGKITRPPMETTAENLRLYEQIKAVSQRLGMDLGSLESGGGSDANLAAELGVPTIDGLGPIGGGHHSDSEYLSIPSLFDRIKLLTEFLATL